MKTLKFDVTHRLHGLPMPTLKILEDSLDAIRQSPRDAGVLRMIVVRPDTKARRVVDEAEIDLVEGVVGDNWRARGGWRGGAADPEAQVTLMNIRAIDAIATDPARRPEAGDQLFVDFDLSVDHLPAGTTVAVGEALLRISKSPHTGCRKFSARFGADATKFVNSKVGKQLRLRGVNAAVVRGGMVRVGDLVRVEVGSGSSL
jgi:MOSC domain-containing protein YiiM